MTAPKYLPDDLRPTEGELADAYNAGMKAEQGKGPGSNPHLPGGALRTQWNLGYAASAGDRYDRERAQYARLDADTEWDE